MLTTFEQAQELKKAGYNQKATAAYNDSGILLPKTVSYNWNDNFKHYCAAPTVSEACDFLRSKGLHVYADSSRDWSAWYAVVIPKDGSCDTGTGAYPTHDTALSAGVSHALMVLKEQNNG